MPRIDSFLGEFLAIVRCYKLTSLTSSVLFVTSFYAVSKLIRGELYSEHFNMAASTVLYYSMVFIFTAVLLMSRGLRDVEAFSIALSTTISAIWLYELIYHYSFPIYFNYFKYPYFDFKDFRTLFNHGGLAALILVGYRHIKVKKNYYFITAFLSFSTTYALWLLTGFYHLDGKTYLPAIIIVNDPVSFGFFMNRLSKLLLCVAWIMLYVKRFI